MVGPAFGQNGPVHEAVKWRDSGRWIPNGGGPVPTQEDLMAQR